MKTPRSLGLLIFLSLACFAQAADTHAVKPNVVILFTDDQGTLDAGCYGSDHLITPNIDKLAAAGVRFTQAYSHTVCCPARAALLTGRQPRLRTQHPGWQGPAKMPSLRTAR